MIDSKSIISTVVSTVFVIAISTVPTISLAESAQSLNKSLMLAQVPQHEQDKESAHGSHDKSKEGDSKHGAKKHGSMKKDRPDYAHMVISHSDTLKLSNEQLGKIVRLHLKHEQEHKKLKAELKKSMKTFKKESMKPSTSDARLREIGKDQTNAFNAMVEHHITERHGIHAVLTTDQINKLKTMKMQHGDQDSEHNHH